MSAIDVRAVVSVTGAPPSDETTDALRHSRADCVTVLPVVGSDGRPKPTALPRPTPTAVVRDGLARAWPRFGRRRCVHPAPRTVSDGWVVGDAVAIDADLLARVGGLDPRFRTPLAVADLCERVATIAPAVRLEVLPRPFAHDPLDPARTSNGDWFADTLTLAAGRPGGSWRVARLALRVLASVVR